MGAVYEATHARLAGRYAIKVLLGEHLDSPELRARFDREARITSLLQHPNVVQVIDHNSTADGTSYLVMEFLSGESLAARLARVGRLPVAAVVDIVEQIAAGLAAAHARGVVHRDLKPDNIYLVPVEGRATELIKILDFGISKVNWSRDTIDREICGTPQYMAPEQVEGRMAEVDATSDQWALAVIAHELLTGKNAFAAETFGETFALVRAGVVPPTGLGSAVDAVVARALRDQNPLRFPSVTAFAEAFREAALPPLAGAVAAPASDPVPLPPPTEADQLPAQPPPRARRRGRDVRIGVAAAAAIAITSFLGTGAANRTPARDSAARIAPKAWTAPLMVGAPLPEANQAKVVIDAIVPAPAQQPIAHETIVATAIASRVARPPARRTRGAPTARGDRPLAVIPTAPVAREPRRALSPDEDETLPLSDL